MRAAAIRKNVRRIREALRSADAPMPAIIPMVKANAYGLGVDRAVRVFESVDPWGYGVATVDEGTELRRLGIERPILVCSPVPTGSQQAAVNDGLTLSFSDLHSLARLEKVALKQGRSTDFQIEVDTGMGRSGFDWREAAEWGPRVRELSGGRLRWTGSFTHLHSADCSDPSSVRTQWERFKDAAEAWAPQGAQGDDFLLHVANSGGALRCGGLLPPAVRAGIFLYGGSAGSGLPSPEPVASLRARVVFIRQASPGSTLGYGATYAASGRERWATLAIGYGDGLARALGNRGHALLKGTRVPIIGRVSMDVTVVNISALDGVEVGDVATLIGRDGHEEITVDEVAGRTGTIAYEVLTGLTARLPRIWVDDGET